MRLLWDATRFPRTMTREEWRAADRWRRVTQRTLREDAERRMANLVAYGTTHPEIFERLINPPLLQGPMFDEQS